MNVVTVCGLGVVVLIALFLVGYNSYQSGVTGTGVPAGAQKDQAEMLGGHYAEVMAGDKMLPEKCQIPDIVEKSAVWVSASAETQKSLNEGFARKCELLQGVEIQMAALRTERDAANQQAATAQVAVGAANARANQAQANAAAALASSAAARKVVEKITAALEEAKTSQAEKSCILDCMGVPYIR